MFSTRLNSDLAAERQDYAAKQDRMVGQDVIGVRTGHSLAVHTEQKTQGHKGNQDDGPQDAAGSPKDLAG